MIIYACSSFTFPRQNFWQKSLQLQNLTVRKAHAKNCNLTFFCAIAIITNWCSTSSWKQQKYQETIHKKVQKERRENSFVWLPAARVRVRSSVSHNNTKKTIHVREKQQKHSKSLARTMNELIKQIRKQINPPWKSASEMRDPFRNRVINGGTVKTRGEYMSWRMT